MDPSLHMGMFPFPFLKANAPDLSPKPHLDRLFPLWERVTNDPVPPLSPIFLSSHIHSFIDTHKSLFVSIQSLNI
ncbi:hypothetical protein RJT34_23423 [Clitoria ternatea]|uniref:Uncharacterized protein n=1 Tax=Clitoria ternatea TaxID=43366 RepID=A0AAN9IIE8_CLITE